jgi:hypothetical protein
MKLAIRPLAVFAVATMTTALGALSSTLSTAAAQFGQTEVEQSQFIAVASPYRGGSAHQLIILEQLSEQRPCWSEWLSAPDPALLNPSTRALTIVDPLLLGFDFTGICSRSTDSNGYSIRVNGEDFGLRYSVRIVYHNGDMLLVGAPGSRHEPYIYIGHTNGMTQDFAKITLNPGWRFTKRTYADRTLGHVYLTYDGPLTATLIEGIETGGSSIAPPRTSIAALFPDTRSDIYLAEINQAVEIGFIAGFEDNTFRPAASLTREQLVSMIIEALGSLPGVALTVPSQATRSPYADVAADRWSAAKIEFAQQNNIVSGYQDGTFRPAQPVTRAELMAVLRRAAEYAQTWQGQSSQLVGDRPETLFSDTSGHWAQILIGQMSTFCNVATPLNERGTSFAPDRAAQRNYATAATLRMLSCVNPGETAQRQD